MSASWYRNGAQWVVVETGMPEHAVKIGVGDTPHEAWDSLAPTAMQSVGPDSGEAAALRWARNAEWIDGDEGLESVDDIADHACEPLGEVEWSDDTYPYVSCVYGDDGNQPGDCYVRVGEDKAGLWWLDDGDDDLRQDQDGPWPTEAAVREAAEALAEGQHKGEPGEDAETYLRRTLSEAAGEPSKDGAWACYWHTALDDSHAETRYATRKQAEAAAKLAQLDFEARHPGPVMCGYEVRHLEHGEWVKLEDYY